MKAIGKLTLIIDAEEGIEIIEEGSTFKKGWLQYLLGDIEKIRQDLIHDETVNDSNGKLITGKYEYVLYKEEYYDGQYGDEGQCEIAPYTVRHYDLNRIKPIKKVYLTLMGKELRERRRLNKRLDNLKKLVDSLPEKDGMKLILHAPWGNQISLSSYKAEGSWMSSPIMTFENKLNEANMSKIERRVKLYIETGEIETDPPPPIPKTTDDHLF